VPNDRRNILAQPLDGGAPTPLTRFTDREIGDFSLSPDGTRTAITRTTRISDVVLIKGLKCFIAWLCWVPNLAVAEWIIRRRTGPSLVSSRASSAMRAARSSPSP
jgi:hypothetical protein